MYLERERERAAERERAKEGRKEAGARLIDSHRPNAARYSGDSLMWEAKVYAVRFLGIKGS